MANEKIRDEPQNPIPQDDQMSDILLLIDNKKNVIETLSKIDKNGKAKTVPADEKNQEDFLKIDKSSIIENFVSNLWRQFKNPTHFTLLRMSIKDYRENKKVLNDIANGRDTDRVKEFLKKYKIVPRGINEKKNNNEKNENVMAKQTNEQTQPQTSQTHDQSTNYRFKENLIDFDQLKAFGISKEYLKESGLLDPMLKGYKTNRLVPISMNLGTAVLRTDARLSFQFDKTGQVVLAMHGIRKEAALNQAYFGHVFSQEDKKNLLETGNMGRVVELKDRSGNYVPSFISIDKLTNEVVSMRAENVFIPKEISSVKLDENEILQLKEGKAIFVESMISKNGKEFNAHLQVNADRRGIDYIFPDRLSNTMILGGVELTAQQSEALNAGKAILVEDMKRKDGTLYDAYVKLDEASGRPNLTRFNPDSPEGAREIIIPKELGGAPLTSEDRQQLGEGKAVFVEDMINKQGEAYSSFVKLDMDTGRTMYSRSLDGFEERVKFAVPDEIWGKKLTTIERATIQDGKAVLLDGMIDRNGEKFSGYARVNKSGTQIEILNENPNIKKTTTQTTAPSQGKPEEKKQSQDKPENKAKENKQSQSNKTTQKTGNSQKKPNASPKKTGAKIS